MRRVRLGGPPRLLLQGRDREVGDELGPFVNLLHQREVARLRGAQERGRAVLVQPLVREHGACLGARVHARVHVGSAVDQLLDDLEMVHVGLARRIIAALDVAIVRRDVERAPAALVLNPRIGAALEQILKAIFGGLDRVLVEVTALKKVDMLPAHGRQARFTGLLPLQVTTQKEGRRHQDG